VIVATDDRQPAVIRPTTTQGGRMSHHLAARAGLAAAATAALLAIPGVALADTCGGGGGPIYPIPPVPPFGTVIPVAPDSPINPTAPVTDPGSSLSTDQAKKPGHSKHPGGGKPGHKGTTGTTGTSGHKHKKHPKAPVQNNGPASTTISVSAGKNPHADQPLTLTARLAVGRGHVRGIKAETGTITFVVDSESGKPVPIKHGRASEKVTLKEGRHTITADYSGDADHRPSESALVALTLN
jgi:hypothetical protein